MSFILSLLQQVYVISVLMNEKRSRSERLQARNEVKDRLAVVGGDGGGDAGEGVGEEVRPDLPAEDDPGEAPAAGEAQAPGDDVQLIQELNDSLNGDNEIVEEVLNNSEVEVAPHPPVIDLTEDEVLDVDVVDEVAGQIGRGRRNKDSVAIDLTSSPVDLTSSPTPAPTQPQMQCPVGFLLT